MPATSPQDINRINAMFVAVRPLMEQLTMRWADEREYEDIADYQTAIEKALPSGFTIVKMMKRPFGFHFTVGTSAVYKLTSSFSTYGWSRLK